jgi:hypothetical protein
VKHVVPEEIKPEPTTNDQPVQNKPVSPPRNSKSPKQMSILQECMADLYSPWGTGSETKTSQPKPKRRNVIHLEFGW